ncbi:MAG: hypothetical protein HXY44_11960 [Syntrophaceae bacterium]|nr:hypothetical protein [Syntrophaceae bacterium]
MTLEKFERQQRPDWPAATIRKNGSLSLNHKAIEEFHLEGKRIFTLHIDSKAGQIGIKPADDDKDPSAFKVCKERGKTLTIGCQAFLKAAKIPYWQGSRVLKAEWDSQKGMLIVKIS